MTVKIDLTKEKILPLMEIKKKTVFKSAKMSLGVRSVPSRKSLTGFRVIYFDDITNSQYLLDNMAALQDKDAQIAPFSTRTELIVINQLMRAATRRLAGY